MIRRKLFAPFIMLLSGAVVSIAMCVGGYDTTQLLLILLFVMIVFYIGGLIIQKRLVFILEQISEQERLEAEAEAERERLEAEQEEKAGEDAPALDENDA